jgi:hypothetical protein
MYLTFKYNKLIEEPVKVEGISVSINYVER